MKSPFPGMDPYLERHWPDVQNRLVTYGADSLNEQLPDSLVARLDERIVTDAENKSGQDDPVKQHFIRIIGTKDERLVTVVEFISPANKNGAGLKDFRQIRSEMLAAGIHRVEVDLVRQGNWRALLRPYVCATKRVTEYRLTVWPGGDGRKMFLYPVPLRESLPVIPIPLRREDPQVLLNLQLLIESVYTRGRYAASLRYNRPLSPPMSEDDAKWVERLLQKRADDEQAA